MNYYIICTMESGQTVTWNDSADDLRQAHILATSYAMEQTGEQIQKVYVEQLDTAPIYALIKKHKNDILDSCDWWWSYDHYDINVFCYDDNYDDEGRLSPDALFSINLYDLNQDNAQTDLPTMTLREIRLL